MSYETALAYANDCEKIDRELAEMQCEYCEGDFQDCICGGDIERCKHGYLSCLTCAQEDTEPRKHYHVVSFINGCLNDYDSGAIDTLEDARIELAEYVENSPFDSFDTVEWQAAGVDRFVQVEGLYVAKIEPCTQNCLEG